MNERDLAIWLSCFTAAIGGSLWMDRPMRDRKRVVADSAKLADQMMEEFRARELGVRKV